jgi:hypothetical protein
MARVAALMVTSTSCHGWWRRWVRWRRWGAEDLRKRADVELAGVGAAGRADPEPVAAADGQVWRQAAGDGPGD